MGDEPKTGTLIDLEVIIATIRPKVHPRLAQCVALVTVVSSALLVRSPVVDWDERDERVVPRGAGVVPHVDGFEGLSGTALFCVEGDLVGEAGVEKAKDGQSLEELHFGYVIVASCYWRLVIWEEIFLRYVFAEC